MDLLDCVANEEGLIDRDTMGAATPDRGSKLEHIMAQLLTGKVVSVWVETENKVKKRNAFWIIL